MLFHLGAYPSCHQHVKELQDMIIVEGLESKDRPCVKSEEPALKQWICIVLKKWIQWCKAVSLIIIIKIN